MDGEKVLGNTQAIGSTVTVLFRYYSLEVVQHPLRARMCGFGDKVRSVEPIMPTGTPSSLLLNTGPEALSSSSSSQNDCEDRGPEASRCRV
jgi:Velvet factor